MLADSLTGLPTRPVFVDELRAARARRVTGVMAPFDVDDFKHLNILTGLRNSRALDELMSTVLGAPDSPRTDVAVAVTVTVGVATGTAGCTLRQLLIAAAGQVMNAEVTNARNRAHATHLPGMLAGTSIP